MNELFATNTRQFVTEWTEYTRQRLVRHLQKQGVKVSIGSYDDFVQTSIHERGSALIESHFTFRLSGRFIDMGVGKGTPFSESVKGTRSTSSSQQDKRHKRTRKNWYSSVMYGRIAWLREAITIKVIEEAVSNFPIPPTINL